MVIPKESHGLHIKKSQQVLKELAETKICVLDV